MHREGALEPCRGDHSRIQSSKDKHMPGRKLFKAQKRSPGRTGGTNAHCSCRARNRVCSHQADEENGHFPGSRVLRKVLPQSWEQFTLNGARCQTPCYKSEKQDQKGSNHDQVTSLHPRTKLQNICRNTKIASVPTKGKAPHNVWRLIKNYQTGKEAGNSEP